MQEAVPAFVVGSDLAHAWSCGSTILPMTSGAFAAALLSFSGPLPARRVTAHLNRKWVPYGQKLPKDFSYPDFGEVGPSSIAVLSPGKSKTFTFPIDPREIEQVRNKETALFLYGHIDYVDVFGEPRTSQFNYQYVPIIGDDGKDRGHSLLMQPDHNDAK
jgi:hypothetical protein